MADTAGSAWQAATARLRQSGVVSASLDARLLLQDVLGIDHAALIADQDLALSAAQKLSLEALVVRREQHEPVSRILGWREFYGRRFEISPAVLDPRPDSETLIDAALEVARQRRVSSLIDLGTGSGILALTLLAEMPDARALATDRSDAALGVARANAKALGVAQRVSFQEADWWQGIEGWFDLIISNPPYIAAGDISALDSEVKDHDPLGALDGGRDGLDCYRAIAEGAAAHLAEHGIILLEIGAGQATEVGDIFFANKFNILAEKSDLGGHLRVLAFKAG